MTVSTKVDVVTPLFASVAVTVIVDVPLWFAAGVIERMGPHRHDGGWSSIPLGAPDPKAKILIPFEQAFHSIREVNLDVSRTGI